MENNFKESLNHWMQCTSRKYPLYEHEIDEFCKWQESQPQQPIAKQKKITIDEAYRDYRISVRTFNVLNRHKISTINELANYEKKDLEKLRNMGAKSLFELEKIMDEYGIKFEDQ